jgi:hypothetical protein
MKEKTEIEKGMRGINTGVVKERGDSSRRRIVSDTSENSGASTKKETRRDSNQG